MKLKSLFAVGAIFLFAACRTTYRATDTAVVIAPSPIVTFHTKYPTATNIVWTTYAYDPVVVGTVDWNRVGWTTLDPSYSGFMVSFDQDNETQYAWYDKNGYWMGTAVVLHDYTLPVAVTSTLNIRFPAYSITGLSRVTLPAMTAYEVELNKHYYTARVLIDDNGNVINQRVKSS